MAHPSEAERRALIAHALDAADRKTDAERIRIPWKAGEYRATVVELEVGALVLNPRSHRIKSQLESLNSDIEITTDPYSAESQNIIASILRDAEKFEGLKQDLKDVGQLEPGVVTVEGMLVNANTRCVALRDIGARYIRVAVLPDDAQQSEIDRLELSLQMKRDFRSDYTYTNELLFVEELIASGRYKPKNVALEMGWASETNKQGLRKAEDQVQQYLRILTLIRELQYMSENRLKLIEFDDNRQALTEIDDEVETLKRKDLGASREVKHARLAGLLSNVGYRELREIDSEFVERYLVPTLEYSPILKPYVDALTKPPVVETETSLPGLDILKPNSKFDSTRKRTAELLLRALTNSAGNDDVVIKIHDSVLATIPRSQFRQELRAAFESAAEDVRLDKKEGDQLDRPIELVRKAVKHVRAASDAYNDVKHREDFDTGLIKSALSDLKAASDGLTETLSEGMDT